MSKYKPLPHPIESYERTDYANLAKEFGCFMRIGEYGIKLTSRDPYGKIIRLFQVIPLKGWYTDPRAVEHIVRERGFEL